MVVFRLVFGLQPLREMDQTNFDFLDDGILLQDSPRRSGALRHASGNVHSVDGWEGMPKRPMWRVAQFDTLRLRLVKIAARVVEIKTMIRVHLPTACPGHELLRFALAQIPRLVT